MSDKQPKLVSTKIADAYQDLYNLMSQEHNVNLTISEMDDIRHECKKIEQRLKEIFNQEG